MNEVYQTGEDTGTYRNCECKDDGILDSMKAIAVSTF